MGKLIVLLAAAAAVFYYWRRNRESLDTTWQQASDTASSLSKTASQGANRAADAFVAAAGETKQTATNLSDELKGVAKTSQKEAAAALKDKQADT